MNHIQVLDKKTINQIAAGEVIDRPASIVKELMENSIDAGASIISVEIKDGGVSLIRISDNGCGIEADDVKIAFLRHSTSKIKTATDLLSVTSLGFRGEALSSIAAVCQVSLITKTADSLTGIRYVIEGGNEISFEEVGAGDGTTFVIKNIFYNTPARRKFLKSYKTETSYIYDVICHIALSHPEISIRFISNGQSKLHTPGNNKLKDVIYEIYGKEISDNLIYVDEAIDDFSITGFIGKPIINRGNKSFENYFVNKRFIKNTVINKAIEEAYSPYVMQHKYPFCVLSFDISTYLLDVNVHPAKMELRIRNSEELSEFIIDTIGAAIKNDNIIPEIKLSDIKIDTKSDTVKEECETEQNAKQNAVIESELITTNNPVIHTKEHYVRPAEPFEINRLKQEEKSLTDSHTENYLDITESYTQQSFLSEEARKSHRIIGQVFNTYWIVEYDNKMYIIDQHAAHEKVLYEKLIRRFNNRSFDSQQLNPPEIFTFTMREENLINSYSSELKNVGFEFEPFGGNEYALRSIPLDLYSLNYKDLIIEIIDNLSKTGDKLTTEILNDRIATMSCKAAVKGNNQLSLQEADTLIDELLSLDNPYNCPHGRPTIISMTKNELEKKFKRIV